MSLLVPMQLVIAKQFLAGNYKGQLMMWSAFPDVTSALQGASKYES